MAGPSLLSATWFPVEQRTTATAIAYLGGSLGSALGFLLGPYLTDSDPQRVAVLLWVTLALALVPLIALLAYCPDRPRHAADQGTPATLRASLWQYARDLRRTTTDPSLVVLSTLGGAQAGIASAWSGVLPQILAPPEYSSVFSGWCGCAFSIAGVAGIVGAGLLGDRFFVGRLKALLVLSYFLSAVFFIFFTFSTSNPYASNPWPSSSPALMVVLLVAAGFFQSACDPLFYEMAAEISYPLPEGTSAGFISLLFNVATLIMLFVAPVIATNLVNTIMALTMVAGGFGTWALVKEGYRRLHAEGADSTTHLVSS
jgi:MFS family permease